MKVNIEELNKITSLLLSKIKEKAGNEVEINSDFYWDINSSERYSPYEEPKNISLGQLSDDLVEVNRLSSNSDEAIPYDLKRVAEIIKILVVENPIIF